VTVEIAVFNQQRLPAEVFIMQAVLRTRLLGADQGLVAQEDMV
jgi:hypothetical protein